MDNTIELRLSSSIVITPFAYLTKEYGTRTTPADSYDESSRRIVDPTRPDGTALGLTDADDGMLIGAEEDQEGRASYPDDCCNRSVSLYL
jgi:hypothetical protein